MRHVRAYAGLGAAAFGEYRAALAKRLCWLALAMLAGLAGLAAAWMAGLVALWETPWRFAYVATSAGALLAIAAIAAAVAMRSPRDGRATGLLRDELAKDRELFAQWTRLP
ncbi:MAG: hypothetical protein DIU62_008710 [Pseudomonadota bacterium]